MIYLKEPKQFQWDAGNERKNTDKHTISQSDAEQVFFNQPLFLLKDAKHSQDEARFHALGRTDAGKELHITFTLRDDFIRVISARKVMKKKGRCTMKKQIPQFKTEVEERVFWEENDSTDFMDWDGAEQVIFPNLKPTTKSISLRLSEMMLAEIKAEANKRDIPYQSLMKMWLSERLAKQGV